MEEMSFQSCLVVLAFFGRVYCSDEVEQYRIISGIKVSTVEFPYMAEILRSSAHWCGGSVIHEYFILTAAHCLCGVNKSASAHEFTVLVGNDVRLIGGMEYEARKFIIHENYNVLAKMDKHDIALIKLKRQIMFTERVKPVALATLTPEPGEMGWVVGFGRVNPRRAVSRGHLMAVKLAVVGLDTCTKILKLVAKDMICAGKKNGSGDACQGDSGGPYVIGKYQVGVVAGGRGCGREGIPGVYTNVAYYKNWIESKIESEIV